MLNKFPTSPFRNIRLQYPTANKPKQAFKNTETVNVSPHFDFLVAKSFL